MFCIALTGTIASGKSTVAALFKGLGVDVLNADEIGKSITNPGEPALLQIADHFGSSVLTETGALNRRALREIIFANSQERTWLEQLLHPLIRKRLQELKDQCKGSYCIIEIPLLFKRESYPYLNRVLLVTADTETRILRIMARDQHSREEALQILASQASEAKYLQIADDVLINGGLITELQRKIDELHAKYQQYANSIV